MFTAQADFIPESEYVHASPQTTTLYINYTTDFSHQWCHKNTTALGGR